MISQHIQPASLVTLAMEALGDYVGFLCFNFSALDQRDSAHSTFHETCKNLKELLHNSLPQSLVNDVTYTLLKSVDNLFDVLHGLHEKSWCQEVLQGIVSSIIHPAVTILDFGSSDFPEMSHGYDWNFIFPFVCRAVGDLSNLKKLRISKLKRVNWVSWVVRSVNVAENLQEFTFMYYSTDSLLEVISESCKQLKCLDVNGSMYVSDSSVSVILKFCHLIKLNVEMTSISKFGFTRLLNGLAKNRASEFGYSWSCASQLLSYGCDEVTSSHLSLLADNFPNLTEVSLTCNRNCELSALKRLENLNVLRLSCVKFSEIEQLMVTFGNQLQCLDICYVAPIDVRIIGETCSSLKCLRISSSDTSSIPVFEESLLPLPGFKSVICLCLHLDYNPEMTEYILCHCVNVRAVNVSIVVGNDNAIIDSVLKRNSLKYLEQLNWLTYRRSKWVYVAKQVVKHCPNLRILRVPYVRRRRKDVRKLSKDIARFMYFDPKFL
jgi:Leucine-rich repeat (LRR) protein